MKMPNNHEHSIFLRLFKKNINKNKKLEPKYFKKLSAIVRDGEICSFLSLFPTFTNNEANVIGRAILKNRMINIEDVLLFLFSKKCKYHIIILTYLLCKGKKIEHADKLTQYIKSFLNDERSLCFYKLILVVCRKYKQSIDHDIVLFCEENEHPVLKEVLKQYQISLK